MSSLRMVYDDAGPTEIVKEESSGDCERPEMMNKNCESAFTWSNVPIKKEIDSEEDTRSQAGVMIQPKEESFEEDSMVGNSLAPNLWREWPAENQDPVTNTDPLSLSTDGDVLARNGRMSESDKEKEKEEVVEKLRNGQYILLRKERSRSKVWEKFSSVYDTTGNRYIGYVQCSNCGCLLVMKLGSGTSHLSRHVCKPDSDYGFALSSIKLKTCVYDKCVEKCVEMCARDLRPFSTVSGEGFQALGQELIKIGAVYGNVSVTSILPKPAVISQHISQMAYHTRAAVAPEIQTAIHDGVCALDFWTEKINKTQYVAVAAQYISEVWKMHRQIIFTSKFSEVQNVDVKIQEEVLLRLRELQLSSEEIKKLRFVSDESSCSKYALMQTNFLPCMKHCLNSVISEALDEDKFLKLNTPQLTKCLKIARHIVHVLKTADHSKQSQTETVLSVYNPLAVVIETVYSNYEFIVQILNTKKETSLLHGWNNELVSQFVTFYVKFKEVLSELQNRTYPTLHLVVVYIYELREHCTPASGDHPEIVLIKDRMKTLLRKIKISEEHYVATFLCPNTRLLKQLNFNLKERIHKMVRKLCSKVSADTVPEYHPPPSKRSRFGAWCQHEEDEKTSFDEIALYLATGRLQNEDPSCLLSWWKEKSTNFPRLSQIARQVLCIPAASTSCEHIFNMASFALTERCGLIPDSLSDLLVVHSQITNEGTKEDVKPAEVSLQPV